MRALLLLVCLTLCVGVASDSGGTATALAAASRSVPADAGQAPGPVRYGPPITGAVVIVRGFEPPPNPYAAGHRGVDLASSPDETVLAAGAGVVRFAGQEAGRGVVVIAHADGISTEYEPLHVLVSAGQRVARGQPIGRLRGRHGSCTPGGCLHWGAQRAGHYLDPMTLLRALGPVRLLPWRTSTRT